jgi:hypothetical protein
MSHLAAGIALACLWDIARRERMRGLLAPWVRALQEMGVTE